MALATFAAGCFWGVEAEFASLPGVRSTEVGYVGGTAAYPTYRKVCSHTTGHAEAVRVEFDPEAIGYEQLLTQFFAMHDPTQRGRQGPDVGDQYRSAIFFHAPEQQAAATEMIRRLNAEGRFNRPVATEVVPAGDWWPAEEEHQQYFAKRGMSGCSI
ncbi:MAG TPA: peptide-methionine (S)-S-oxide reductase MsrA [Thermoleophilia bacterium]|nr:peptide-methionine (S)-S-oxide reductase MsrA [Thermoleophilia bacterium]